MYMCVCMYMYMYMYMYRCMFGFNLTWFKPEHFLKDFSTNVYFVFINQHTSDAVDRP